MFRERERKVNHFGKESAYVDIFPSQLFKRVHNSDCAYKFLDVLKLILLAQYVVKIRTQYINYWGGSRIIYIYIHIYM